MMLKSLLSALFVVTVLVGGSAQAEREIKSCAYSAADGMRQNANLLLFLVDARLVASSIMMDMPEEIKASSASSGFETYNIDGSSEHWKYIPGPEATKEGDAPVATFIPILELHFGSGGQLEGLQQVDRTCPVSGPKPTKEEILALLAQQQRLKFAILIGQNCSCITRESLRALADWVNVATLDLPRSTLNLFQPYVAFGPQIELVSDTVIRVVPVSRNPQNLGYVSVDDLSEGLILGVESAAAKHLIRAIPYYER